LAFLPYHLRYRRGRSLKVEAWRQWAFGISLTLIFAVLSEFSIYLYRGIRAEVWEAVALSGTRWPVTEEEDIVGGHSRLGPVEYYYLSVSGLSSDY
jgi:hypothetical protein